eukprot:755671-Hanusia_phi.AAC.7
MSSTDEELLDAFQRQLIALHENANLGGADQLYIATQRAYTGSVMNFCVISRTSRGSVAEMRRTW